MVSNAFKGLLVLCLGVLLTSCGQDGSENPVKPGTGEGVLLVSKFSPMTQAEMDSIPPEVMALAHEHGWYHVSGGMEQLGPGINLTVRSGNLRVVTDGAGKFQLLGIEPHAAIKVFAGEQEITDLPLEVTWEDGRCTAKLHYSLVQKRAHQHHGSPQIGPGPGDSIRCLDYNGPYGNQINYSHWYWRAWVNYVGSDCDLAFYQAACYLDNITPWGPCDGQHNCSATIGHCFGYHRHTSYGWPRC